MIFHVPQLDKLTQTWQKILVLRNNHGLVLNEIGLKPVFSAMLEARRSGEVVNMLGEDWLPMMVIFP